MIHNIPADLSDEQVKQIFDDDKDSILRIIRIKLTTVVIEVKEVNQKEKLMNKYKNMQSPFLDTNKLDISEFNTPKSEVIYIKYDSINMKYLYICSNCGTSWKNN